MTSVALSLPTLEAGIDYVTCTAKRPAIAAALLAYGKDLVQQEIGAGGVRKPFHFSGYAGWQAGSASYGFKSDGTLVRTSGATARECAAELIECAENVSRLDIQITVRADGVESNYASDLYESMAISASRRGRRLTRQIIKQSDGGQTLYLGRGVSDSYGRIYNKSAEEKTREYPPRWRYEVEHKRKRARDHAWAYSSSSDKEAWCVSQVYHWFTDRGVRPAISAVSRCNDSGASRGSDKAANRIQWLKVGVRPVVKELAAEYGWPDVLALLGVPMVYSDKYVNETLCAED